MTDETGNPALELPRPMRAGIAEATRDLFAARVAPLEGAPA